MSLLSYTQICDLIEDGVVENADYANVNSASLDLTLGPLILVEDCPFKSDEGGFHPRVISLKNREQILTKRFFLNENNSFTLKPGQFILAQTREIFHLPCDISSEYKLKSSMARMGLEHLNAGFCDSGWNNSVLTLEFRNLTTYHDIELKLGDKIGQMLFFRHEPVPIEKSYAHRGTYNNSRETTATKQEKEAAK